MYRIQSSKNILLIMLKIFFLVALFSLMNYDKEVNPDYSSYKIIYDEQRDDFDIGFRALSDIANYIGFDFALFWQFILLLEVFLISVLYRHNTVFFLAVPNLMYLSQFLFGTQVRFGLASLLFLIVLNKYYKQKNFYIWSIVPFFFHKGLMVAVLLANFMKRFVNTKRNVTYKNNMLSVAVLIFFIAFFSLFMDQILVYLGYSYYVDSEYQEGRSLISILYMVINLSFLGVFLSTKCNENVSYMHMYIGSLLLMFALIFMQSSVTSGRYNLIYLLIEPFIFKNLFSYVKSKWQLVTVFMFYLLSTTKVASIGYHGL